VNKQQAQERLFQAFKYIKMTSIQLNPMSKVGILNKPELKDISDQKRR
jgi:hypothetical protein